MRITTLTSQGSCEQVHHHVEVESSAGQSSRGRHSHRLQCEQCPAESLSTQPPQPYVAALVLREDQGNKAMKALYEQ